MIELVPWSETDLWVVDRCLSDAEMMRHLGGPQNEYASRSWTRTPAISRPAGRDLEGCSPSSTQPNTAEIVGNIGYWDKSWRD